MSSTLHGRRAERDDASPLRRAKRPASLLAGPYGHPFHATAVVIPIGAWTASVVFDLLALFGVEPTSFAFAATWLILIGVIGAAIAAVFGLLDLSRIAAGTKARRTGLLHLAFNSAAVLLFLISFFIRLGEPHEEHAIAFILSVIAILGVGVSGFLGGELAYRYGVRVADEETQLRGYE